MSKKNSGYGMLTPIHFIVLAGVVIGAAAALTVAENASLPEVWIISIACGIGLAYVLFALADCVMRGLALRRDPIADSVDVRDRAAAAALAESLPGSGILARHARRLMAAWGAGAVGPQVSRMAATQLYRSLLSLVAEGVSAFAVVAVAIWVSSGIIVDACASNAAAILLLLIPVVTLARIQQASRESGYIESQLLARIGNDTPAAAASDFAEKAAAAMADATAKLTDAQKAAASTVEASTAKLAEAQQKALAALADAQAKSADAIAKAQAEAAATAAKASTDTAATMAQGQAEVAKQLARVTDIAASVDNVLQIQKSVDGTLKGVATTDEFRSTLAELKRHLAESDELIKTATKPRRIRFVENPAE